MSALIKLLLIAALVFGGYKIYDYLWGECPADEVVELVENHEDVKKYLEDNFCGDVKSIAVKKIRLRKDKEDKENKTFRGQIIFERMNKEYTRPFYVKFIEVPSRMNKNEQPFVFGIDYRCYIDDKYALIEDAEILFDRLKSGKSKDPKKRFSAVLEAPPLWFKYCYIKGVKHVSAGVIRCEIQYSPGNQHSEILKSPFRPEEKFTVDMVVDVEENGEKMTWQLKEVEEQSNQTDFSSRYEDDNY